MNIRTTLCLNAYKDMFVHTYTYSRTRYIVFLSKSRHHVKWNPAIQITKIPMNKYHEETLMKPLLFSASVSSAVEKDPGLISLPPPFSWHCGHIESSDNWSRSWGCSCCRKMRAAELSRPKQFSAGPFRSSGASVMDISPIGPHV